MFAVDFSNFKPVEDTKVREMIEGSVTCLYEASDGTCFLFKAEDMAKVVAITPSNVDASIYHSECEDPESPLITTFGCFINKCRISDLKEKSRFIETVNKYQQSDEEIEVEIVSAEQAEAYLQKLRGYTCT